jgi:hypothetical protein
MSYVQKNSFFERTGKNAVQRASMQMDVYLEGITLYAGQVLPESPVIFILALFRFDDVFSRWAALEVV